MEGGDGNDGTGGGRGRGRADQPGKWSLSSTGRGSRGRGPSTNPSSREETVRRGGQEGGGGWGSEADGQATRSFYRDRGGGGQGGGYGGGAVGRSDVRTWRKDDGQSSSGGPVRDGGGGAATRRIVPEETVEIVLPFLLKDKKLSKPRRINEIHVDYMNRPNPFCIEVMQMVLHPNVLHMEGELNSEKVIVEQKTGVLSLQFILSSIMSSISNKSQIMQNYVSQMIRGVAGLAKAGYYHGNIVDGRTYYVAGVHLHTVKLANFRQAENPDQTLEVSQKQDRFDLGKWIERTVQIVKIVPGYNTAELQDLSKFLKATQKSQNSAEEWEHESLQHLFFWDEKEWALFFTYHIPKLIAESPKLPFNSPKRKYGQTQLEAEINSEVQIDKNWDKAHSGYYGLVQAMNNYRKNTLQLGGYDGQSRISYVKFVCGCFTHENQVSGDIIYIKKSVFAVFKKCDPEIALKLMRIIRRLHLKCEE